MGDSIENDQLGQKGETAEMHEDKLIAEISHVKKRHRNGQVIVGQLLRKGVSYKRR